MIIVNTTSDERIAIRKDLIVKIIEAKEDNPQICKIILSTGEEIFVYSSLYNLKEDFIND